MVLGALPELQRGDDPALEIGPHFDGFVGSREPFFDIASIEQDEIPRRWARLWKLHGSINWQHRDDGAVAKAQQPGQDGLGVLGEARRIGGHAGLYDSRGGRGNPLRRREPLRPAGQHLI